MKKYLFIIALLLKNNIITPISQYQSIMNTELIKGKYRGLIHFIHEFHHFIASDNFYKSMPNSPLLYCVAHNTTNYHKASGIYNVLQYAASTLTDITKQNIKNIQFYLSGYAAETAYKKRFPLLKYFTPSKQELYQTDFIKFFFYHTTCNKISDIDKALEIANNINYNTKEIQKYITKYSPIVKKNPLFKDIKKQTNNINAVILLFGLYEELIETYTSEQYYKKMYKIINNNPEIFTMEIFFINDLKSLWQKEKLSRDITKLTSYQKEELEI